jgi:hypothetical protein
VEILEIEETIRTGRFFVFENLAAPCGVVLLSDFGSPGMFGAPFWGAINFPEEYTRGGLNVYITYRRFFEGECMLVGIPFVLEAIEIRNVVYTSRFYVRQLGDCGYFLVEDLGDPEPRVLYPVNLPEEYQQEGLSMNVTYRRLWLDDIYCDEQRITTIEIMSIMETPEERAETRIVGGEAISIGDVRWQVLITRYAGDRYERTCTGSIIAPNLIFSAIDKMRKKRLF